MDNFILVNPEYNEGFTVSMYKGTWRLTAAKQGKDKVYETWGEIEIAKDKTKRLPVSVNLGINPLVTLEKIKAILTEAPPF